MRREAGRAGQLEASVLVTSLLVLLGADVVNISEGLVGINDDEVGCADSSIRLVCTKASLENREDGVVRGIDSSRGGRGNEIGEVAGADSLRGECPGSQFDTASKTSGSRTSAWSQGL